MVSSMGSVVLVAFVAVWVGAQLGHAQYFNYWGPDVTGTVAECAAMLSANSDFDHLETGPYLMRDEGFCLSWTPETPGFHSSSDNPARAPCPTFPLSAREKELFEWKWAEMNGGTRKLHNHLFDDYCADAAGEPWKDPERKCERKIGAFIHVGGYEVTFRLDQIRPFPCTCGYRQKTIKFGFDNSATSREHACHDSNECNLGTFNCPVDNSHCANTQGSYQCECDDGYGKTGNLGEVVVTNSESCSPLLSLTVDASSISANVELTGFDEPRISAFTIEVDFVAKLTGQTLPISHLTGIEVPKADILNTDYMLQGLMPGTKHQIRLFPKYNLPRLSDPGVALANVVTTCNCPNDGSGDPTGKPGHLDISQDTGFVMFEFHDNSMCEEAYAFSRSNYGSDVRSVFTSNYYYYSRDTCARDPYMPGKQAADELSQSLLQVGGNYTYCVRAVANKYLPMADSSAEECGKHTVRWEGSVDGRVSLEKSAGSLPTEGVLVNWELLSSSQADAVLITSGEATSDDSGRFKVTLNILPSNGLPMRNEAEYPLHVSFSKTTTSGGVGFDHTFLCADGTIRCTNTGTTLFLRHLDFGKALDVIDDSSVALTGKVVIGSTGSGDFDDTNNDDIDSWSEVGCPLVGAQVCLVDHAVSPNAPGVAVTCVETDAQGEYSLPAVIGTIVHPEVTLLNHVFAPIDSNMNSEYEAGITIEGDKNYRNHDFKDESTNPLLLELAGGLCNQFLGDALFRVTKPNCGWPGVLLIHNDVSAYHDVIAHDVQINFEKVTGRDGVVRNDIELGSQSIDLRELEDEVGVFSSDDPDTGNGLATANGAAADQLGGISADNAAALELEEQEAEKEAEGHRLRFQFDGTTIISVAFQRDQRGGCGTSDTDTSSFHVLHALSLVDVTVTAVQDLGGNVPTCDQLPPDFEINIENGLGFSDSSTEDQAYIARLLNEGEAPERIALFQSCNNGCNFLIEHAGSVEEGNIGNAHVTTSFLVGPPKINSNFLKSLGITTVQPFAGTSFVASVLVIGDYDMGRLFSYAAPTHEPIMIMRDPPGSSSYAVYENVKTTSQVIIKGHDTFVGFSAAVDISVGIDFDAGVCAGLGVQACKDLIRTRLRAGGNTGGGGSFETSFGEKTNAATFTSTWSYTTSSDGYPGKYSDVFVVPTLNVRFNNIQEITFDESQCAGVMPPATQKFDVTAPKEQAVAFLTFFALNRFELPAMRDTVKAKEALMLEHPTGSDDFKKAEAERDQTQTAIEAWERTIASYEATNEVAANNEAGAIKPHEWFNRTVDEDAYKKGFEDFNTTHTDLDTGVRTITTHSFPVLPEAHWSGLVPKLLNEKRESLDPANDPSLEETNIINFGGGGATLSFFMSQDSDKARKHKFGHLPKDNSNGDFHVAPHYSTGIKALLGGDLTISGAVTVHHESHMHLTEGSQVSSKVGFVLGDADVGDNFEVRINLDPDFGSFIFSTINGLSKCPHETGTTPREAPAISITQSPLMPVLPDEPMIFHLELKNQGATFSSFELGIDLRNNTGGLVHSVNGGKLLTPQKYDKIGAGETISTTLVLRRGPELFEYPPMRIFFRSACQNLLRGELLLSNVDYEDGSSGKALRFEEPCPKVSLAGQLARDGTWLINADDEDNEIVTVVVRNPGLSVAGSFFAQAGDAAKRLQKVELLFRQQGAKVWGNARVINATEDRYVDANFATDGIEDSFGFGTILWDVGAIVDGDYEIMVRTVCNIIDGAQAEFDKFPTEVVLGTIDRQRPRQYGLPSPAYCDIYAGQEVTFTFQEEIDCRTPYRFSLDVLIDGLDLIDKDDLLIVCEDRTISFQLDPAKIRLDAVVGKAIAIELDAVRDINFNVLSEKIEHSLTFAAADATSVLASFELVLAVADCATMRQDLEDTVAIILGRILDVITVEESRVRVVNVRCSDADNTKVEASVSINPEQDDGTGERRLRSLQDGNHDAMHLVYALQDGATSGLSVESVVVAQVSDVLETSSVVYLPNPVEADRDARFEAMMATIATQSAALAEQTAATNAKLDAAAAQSDAKIAATASEVTVQPVLKGGVLGAFGALAIGGLVMLVLHRRKRNRNIDTSGALFTESGKSRAQAAAKNSSMNPRYAAYDFDEDEPGEV